MEKEQTVEQILDGMIGDIRQLKLQIYLWRKQRTKTREGKRELVASK